MIYKSLKYTPERHSFNRNSKLFCFIGLRTIKQFTVSDETICRSGVGSVFQTFVNHTLDYFYYVQIMSSCSKSRIENFGICLPGRSSGYQ